MALARMAWRNLWRNKRRTIITLISIAFAVLLAVIFTGMQDASWHDTIDVAARLGGGHVTLQHVEYLDRPTTSRTVTDTAAMVRAAEQHPEVIRAVTRIVGQTLLATANESFGASFIAIDPSTEDERTLSLLAAIHEGAPLTDANAGGIILGERLARNLRAKLGSKVVYTMTDKTGAVVTGLARVSGVLHSGAPSLDLGLCLLPIDRVRAALGYRADEATQVAVFLADNRDSARVAARLAATSSSDRAALTWRQTQPDLASFIAMKRGGMVFFELLILVLCAAGIFNTLFVSVMERLRELGILAALGFSPARLFRLVMWESAWLALVGLGAGALLTAGPYIHLSRVGIDMTQAYQTGDAPLEIAGVGMNMILRVGIYTESAVAIAAAVILATLLAGFYPAWRAGRVEPVETIKLV